MLPVGLMYLLTHIILVWLLKLTEPFFLINGYYSYIWALLPQEHHLILNKFIMNILRKHTQPIYKRYNLHLFFLLVQGE
jgi:hypothetical protein